MEELVNTMEDVMDDGVLDVYEDGTIEEGDGDLDMGNIGANPMVNLAIGVMGGILIERYITPMVRKGVGKIKNWLVKKLSNSGNNGVDVVVNADGISVDDGESDEK